MSTPLVVGTVSFDTIETPSGRAERVQGGSGAYAALACAVLRPVRLVAPVGGDFPDATRRDWASRGIDMLGLRTDERHPTQFWHGRYSDDMETREHLNVEMGILDGYSPTIPPGYAASGHVLLAHAPPPSQLAALGQLPASAFVLADTIDYWIEHQRGALVRVLRRVDLAAVNEQEARLLSRSTDLFTAAARIHQLGPRWVVIKRGSAGSLLSGPEGCTALPAFPTPGATDPTGAGDAFAGGLLAALSAGECVRRAVAVGTVLASFAVEGFGTSALSAVTRGEFQARLERFRESLAI